MFSLPQLALPAELCASDGSHDIHRVAAHLRTAGILLDDDAPKQRSVARYTSPLQDTIESTLDTRLAPLLATRWFNDAECTFHSEPFPQDHPEIAGFIFRDPHDEWEILPLGPAVTALGEETGTLVLRALAETNRCGNWIFQPMDFLCHIESYHWQHEDGPMQAMEEVRDHATDILTKAGIIPKRRQSKGKPLVEVFTGNGHTPRKPDAELRSRLLRVLAENPDDSEEIKNAKWTLRCTDEELCEGNDFVTWKSLEQRAPRWFWSYPRKVVEVKHLLKSRDPIVRLSAEIIQLSSTIHRPESTHRSEHCIDDRHDHFEELSYYSAPTIVHAYDGDGMLHHFDEGANDSVNSGDDMHTFSAIFFDITDPACVRDAFKRLDLLVQIISRADELLTVLNNSAKAKPKPALA